MKNDWIAYHDLIASSTAVQTAGASFNSHSWTFKLSSILTDLGRRMAHALSDRTEPQICRMSDRQGVVSWYVYDPTTATDSYFESEADVRIWLESRHNRPLKPRIETHRR